MVMTGKVTAAAALVMTLTAAVLTKNDGNSAVYGGNARTILSVRTLNESHITLSCVTDEGNGKSVRCDSDVGSVGHS